MATHLTSLSFSLGLALDIIAYMNQDSSESNNPRDKIANPLSSPYTPDFGSGAGEINLVWADKRPLAESTPETLDLNALAGAGSGALGNACNFASIKHLIFYNSSTAQDLVVGNAGSTPFQAGLSAATTTITVKAGNTLIMTCKAAGWTTSSKNNLMVTNGAGGAAEYTLIVAGVSA